jgi:fructose-bisphosphate aldolase class II
MLPSPDQYLAMIDGAAVGRYSFPAINVTSSQTLNAAMRGFAEAGSDGIVQVTVGGARYLSGAAKDALTGARAFAALGRELAERYPVAIALHTDHCPPADADSCLWRLLADSAGRVERRERPLFHSHMFDGSTLPLEENLRLSGALLGRCRELDIVLEVECGVVGGEEDGIGDEGVSRDRLYTTPEDLLRVAEALGTGARARYLLAATFGNVHGVYAPGHVQLRPEILAEGQEALGASARRRALPVRIPRLERIVPGGTPRRRGQRRRESEPGFGGAVRVYLRGGRSHEREARGGAGG